MIENKNKRNYISFCLKSYVWDILCMTNMIIQCVIIMPRIIPISELIEL